MVNDNRNSEGGEGMGVQIKFFRGNSDLCVVLYACGGGGGGICVHRHSHAICHNSIDTPPLVFFVFFCFARFFFFVTRETQRWEKIKIR